MGLFEVNKCFITGVQATNKPSERDSFDYGLDYNGHKYWFSFAANAEWDKVISGEKKTTLSAMLYNGEWPIENDTYITSGLIENILRLGEYPKTFEEKVDYYLLKAYKQGGDEYKTIKYNLKKYLAAFANSSEEFTRILDALEERAFVTFIRPRSIITDSDEPFKLTEEGRKRAKELDSAKIDTDRLKLPSNVGAGVYVCFVKEDDFFGQLVGGLFSKVGFTLHGNDGINQDNNEAFVRNIRSTIYDEKVKYIVFIKSFRSDANTAFNNVLSIAVEAHLNYRSDKKFIFIGFADDSPYKTQPVLMDYHREMFDIRIKAQREKLLLAVVSDFVAQLDLQPEVISLQVKHAFLRWLVTQTVISRGGPVKVTYTQVSNIFPSDQTLQFYLKHLKNDNLIDFTIKDMGNTFYSEYFITVMDSVPDWIAKHSTNNNDSTPIQYHFPILPITEADRKWLHIVHEKFLEGEDIQVAPLFAKHWKEFPEDFQPTNMNYRLIRGGRDITVLGISHIDPQSYLFDKLNRVILATRKILSEGKDLKEINSSMIVSIDDTLSDHDCALSFQLLWHFGGFMTTLQKKTPKGCTIGLTDDKIFDKYRHYKGLEKLVSDAFEQESNGGNKSLNVDESKVEEENFSMINTSEKAYYKFPINIKDLDLEPALGVKELANDFAEVVLDIPNEQGKMIGVFGRWGRGKTFFIKELLTAIQNISENEDKEHIKVDYHAWKYQDTPASWAYLYETLVDCYNPEPKNRWKFWEYLPYYCKIIKLNFERHGWAHIFKLLLSVAFAIVTAFGFIEWGKEVGKKYIPLIGLPFLGVAVYSILQKIAREYSTQAKELIKRYSTKHTFKDTLGLQAEIQKEIEALLKVWVPKEKIGKRKILLIVEDIDRCTEERIIQNIDALRIIVEAPEIASRLIILAAVDEGVLKRAVKSKYSNMASLDEESDDHISNRRLGELITEYLDKLFIAGIKLNSLSDTERVEFFNTLTKSDRHQDSNEPDEKKEVKWGMISEDAMNAVDEKTQINLNDLYAKLSTMREDWDLAVRNGDFVIKDNDFALENEYGEIKTLKEITEENTKNLKLRKSKTVKLTADEVMVLRSHLHLWENVTPRKIRIFYYRYLLAKNLLISKYKKIGRQNIWQSKELCFYFVSSLMRYTDLHRPEDIIADKLQIAGKLGEISEDSDLKKYKVLNRDVSELLSVLELIIAY